MNFCLIWALNDVNGVSNPVDGMVIRSIFWLGSSMNFNIIFYKKLYLVVVGLKKCDFELSYGTKSRIP